jgi:hypothetical protein
MSKRNGAKPVTQYRDEGYLPDAMVNYLARLGWSHGDAEIFSRAQFLEWFNLDHLGKSAAQFDEAKLALGECAAYQEYSRRGASALGQLQLSKRGVVADDRLPAGSAACSRTVVTPLSRWLTGLPCFLPMLCPRTPNVCSMSQWQLNPPWNCWPKSSGGLCTGIRQASHQASRRSCLPVH